MICAENDSDTTVNFSQDQDFHSIGNSDMYDMDQGCLSPAHTEDRDIGESSEVEEMLTYFMEERDIDENQQAAKVKVVDEEDATGGGHEEAGDRAGVELRPFFTKFLAWTPFVHFSYPGA